MKELFGQRLREQRQNQGLTMEQGMDLVLKQNRYCRFWSRY